VAETVAGMCRRKPQIAPETAGLKDYAALVQCCDLFIGGDTGPMHIAGAVGTPILAIFGGTDPRRHAPFGSASEILYAAETPGRVTGAEAEQRLRAITPESAYDTCLRFVKQQKMLAGAPASE
jgi:ADP-heptose:LPS heptosyltransferase